MRKLAKTLLNQGHGKTGFIFEMTEIEVAALRKHFDGKKLKKGCPLDLALQNLRNQLPTPKIPVDKMADLLNPLINWNKPLIK